jgi:WD40 repeat protein/tRNA A-37 threonylcarbamoyl transferase component Bud32
MDRAPDPLPPKPTRINPDAVETVDQAGPASGGGTADWPQRLDPAPGDRPPAPPGYEVLEELGHGGMGVVYKARQIKLNRVVALKMVLGQRTGRKELIRFLAEAEAVAAVRHPGVVQVHEYGEHDGRPFLAMEYLPGGSLSERLRADGQMGARSAARLLGQLADGVQAIHERGIVHRDLKPGNVLFDDAGAPKVTDFGLAKRGAGGDLTATQAVMGTPAYMAPEQASGQTKFAGPAADVYALGVILYECLTGTKPFEGGEAVALLRRVADEAPERPSRRVQGLPRDVELIALKCLAKHPAERYPTAQALADDLARFAAGEPVGVRPAGPVERLAKWARRKPTLASLIALVAVAMTAGTAVSLFFAAQSEARAREASGQKVRAEQNAANEAKARQAEAEARAFAQGRALSARRYSYANAISLALQAWENGLVARAVALLAQQLPGPDEEDLRGFEWYYLWRLCHTERWRSPSTGVVNAVAYAPDGKTVATADSSNWVKMWDAETGARLPIYRFRGRFVAFSPDGKMLVTGDMGGAVRLWDPATGREIATLGRHRGLVACLALSRNGKLLVTAENYHPKTGDEEVILWDVVKRERLASWKGGASCCAVSDDGRFVATGQSGLGDGLVREAATGNPIGKPFHSGGLLEGITFSSDGKTVVYASGDKSLYLHDTLTGEQQAVYSVPTGSPTQVRYGPGGRTLAAGTSFGPVVWNLPAWQRRGFLLESGARAFDFSPDGARVVAGGPDGAVRMWDVIHDWGGEKCGIWFTMTAGLFEKPAAVAVAQFDGKLVVYDPAKRAAAAELKGPETAKGRGTKWATHPSGRVAAVSEKGLILWDSPRGEGHPCPLPGGEGATEVTAVAFSPDGARLAVAWNGKPNRVVVCDAATGAACATRDTDCTALAFAPGGASLLYSVRNVGLWSWEYQTDSRPALLATHGPVLGSLASALTGDLVAGASHDGNVYLWKWPSGEPAATLRGHVGPVHGVAFSPDGKTLATGGQDMAVKLWQTATGQELLSLRGHEEDIYSLAFATDGRSLVSGSGDWQTTWRGSALLWRAADRAAADRELAAELERLRTSARPAPAPSSKAGPPPSVEPPAEPDDIREIYRSLAILELKLQGKEPFRPGVLVRLYFNLFNAGPRALRPPLHKASPVPSLDIGNRRFWIERLGDDPAIPPLEEAGASRTGRRYAQGQAVVTATPTIGPGSALAGNWGNAEVRTAGFPAGRYRYTVEYLTRDLELLQTEAAEFELKGEPIPEVIKEVPPRRLLPHTAGVLALGFSPDGTRLVTGDGKLARVWDSRTGDFQFTLDVAGTTYRAAFSATDRLLTLSNKEPAVRLWDAATGKALTPLPELADAVLEAVFTPDGKRVVCADKSGALTVFDVAEGQKLGSAAAFDPKLVFNGLAISPDGTKACFGLGRSPTWSVKVWDLERSRFVLSTPTQEKAVWGVAWSGNGKWIASGGLDQLVTVWDAATGVPRQTLRGAGKQVARVAIDRHGGRVAATCFDGVLRVWDVETGQVSHAFTFANAGTGGVAFSPDGRRLAGAAPGVVQVFDLPPAVDGPVPLAKRYAGAELLPPPKP